MLELMMTDALHAHYLDELDRSLKKIGEIPSPHTFTEFISMEELMDLAKNCIEHPCKRIIIENKAIVGFDIPGIVCFKNICFKRCWIEFCEINRNARFDFCEFDDCAFNSCNFRYTIFNDCIIKNTKFDKTELRSPIFINTSVLNSKFIASQISEPNIDGKVSFLGTKLNSCSLIAGVGVKLIRDLRDYSHELPMEGVLYGWKAALTETGRPVIVKLEIPANAKRSRPLGVKKCRCSKAKVIGIESLSGKRKYKNMICRSWWDKYFVYELGSEVRPRFAHYDTNGYDTCSNGIHFFLNREDAVEFAEENM